MGNKILSKVLDECIDSPLRTVILPNLFSASDEIISALEARIAALEEKKLVFGEGTVRIAYSTTGAPLEAVFCPSDDPEFQE